MKYFVRCLQASAAAAIVVIFGLIALVIVVDRPSEDGGGSGVTALPRTTPASAVLPASPIASTSPQPGPGPDVTPEPTAEIPSTQGVEVTRLVVPSLGIDAPIITLGVDPDGTMQSPDNPTDVAWYSFSGLPGEGSNIVMAAHLDFVNHGPAVFYRLKEAQPGDGLELALEDGTIARYAVLDVTLYDEATAPVLEIVGPTSTEIVTLITCGGSFDPSSREYDKRVILRAERLPELARASN
jgi:LPXTG-site transpeptidase (sortase) family protein